MLLLEHKEVLRATGFFPGTRMHLRGMLGSTRTTVDQKKAVGVMTLTEPNFSLTTYMISKHSHSGSYVYYA